MMGTLPISVVDLFCGAGGLAHGFLMEGIRVNAGIDVDQECKYPFEKNNAAPFIQKDIQNILPEEVACLYPNCDIKILAGCAPCQPFSTYTQSSKSEEDSRWILLDSFSKLISSLKPEIVTMENVPRLEQYDVFSRFLSSLKNLGYKASYRIVYCPEYGIPQSRSRLVLLASLKANIHLEPPTSALDKFKTVRDAIGQLEPIQAGVISNTDPLHRSSRLSNTNQIRIKASHPGGTWRDWDENLIANCHRKNRGKTYSGVYGRMEWDKPAPTITTQFFGFGNGRFGHPEQDRGLSLREGALLQTFPMDYKFVSSDTHINFKKVGRLIGNAVPVNLARVIAYSIKKHAETYYV